MGTQLIPFKGDGWRGRTTLTTNDRGDKRLVRILNGYVSSDGSEIRSFPGWRTLIDLSDDNNPNGGYSRYVIDAMRPVLYEPSPNQFYTEVYEGGTSDQQTLYARAKPIWFEAFEQVGDTLTILGITRFREQPIYSSARVKLTPSSISTAADGKVTLTMSAAVGTKTSTDAGGAGLNGCDVGDVVYIEDLATANATLNSDINNLLNGKVHPVAAVSGANIVLATQISNFSALGSVSTTAGSVHRVRPNASDSYPTPGGADPYSDVVLDRIDDWNALTSWRIVPALPLKLTNAAQHTSHPAWVANRQRDFGDANAGASAVGYASKFTEGINVRTGGVTRGVSRREQRELPYRIVTEPAGDRILIAAPGYNCMFQVPLMVPFNPAEFPPTPDSDFSIGVPWFGNDIYDKPRALGVPKCRLIEPVFTPAPPSPDQNSDTGNFSHLLLAIDATPTVGFPAGKYRMCATYQDDITGEEGEPSEIVEFEVPSNAFAYYVRVHYFHPGYIMPECLALRLNVYLTAPGGEALGFYKSFDLKSFRAHPAGQHLGLAYNGTGGQFFLSAKYGFAAAASPDSFSAAAEWQTLHLPLPTRNTESSPGSLDFDLGIDFERPPLQVGMPRGASACRWMRGVMVAAGHIGNAGPSKSLYQQYGSIFLDQPTQFTNTRDDEILIRVHDDTNYVVYADGEKEDGFGLAGRAFPDSCQGIEGISTELIPREKGLFFQIDRILNRRCVTLDETGHNSVARERLKTVRPVVDLDYATSPTDPEFVPVTIRDRQFYLRMFKGQIQVSDPGAPNRVTKASGIGIKLTDPNRDDDIVAIGRLAGNAVLCTRKETFFFSWSRSPGGEEPTTVSTEHGCIAPNGMVEFDGGLAWISERGPVALGSTLQFVGGDIQQDFTGQRRRYATDRQGMMRHTWACHDSARGLVMWGLLTEDAAHQLSDGRGGLVVQAQADDGVRSRFPCDEVLIWSYRTNSFSTWRPPSGLEILWMREITIRHPNNENSSTLAVAFLAADGRIYVLDDTWNDTNDGCLNTTAIGAGASSTSMRIDADEWSADGVANGGDTARGTSSISGIGGENYLIRAGHIIQAISSDDTIEWETTITEANPSTDTVKLAAAQTWVNGQTIRIGVKPAMIIETTFVGGEAVLNLETSHLQLRYTLHGHGLGDAKAYIDALLLKSDIETTTDAQEVRVGIVNQLLGTADETRHARRATLPAQACAPEIAAKVTISSEAQVRITDMMLEVG